MTNCTKCGKPIRFYHFDIVDTYGYEEDKKTPLINSYHKACVQK